MNELPNSLYYVSYFSHKLSTTAPRTFSSYSLFSSRSKTGRRVFRSSRNTADSTGSWWEVGRWAPQKHSTLWEDIIIIVIILMNLLDTHTCTQAQTTPPFFPLFTHHPLSKACCFVFLALLLLVWVCVCAATAAGGGQVWVWIQQGLTNRHTHIHSAQSILGEKAREVAYLHNSNANNRQMVWHGVSVCAHVFFNNKNNNSSGSSRDKHTENENAANNNCRFGRCK